MLRTCANKTDMHQPKAVHYISNMYIMYPLYPSFVIQNKDSNCVLYVRVKLPRLTLFRLARYVIETYPQLLAESYLHFLIVRVE